METSRQMLSSSEQEHTLIQRAVSGDTEAYGELYHLNLDAIYRYIYYRVGLAQDAEDLTALVFMKAWEALGSYIDYGNPFSSWLYRIAHNVVIDHHRREKKLEGYLTGGEPVEEITSEIIEGQAENTLEKIIEHEELQILAQAISQLSTDQQQVVILRFIEGLSHSEIADIIGKNEGTCRMIQHRALNALQRLLNGA
jgi:RNA polymerase sigma-70 factor (ECF subfamily)